MKYINEGIFFFSIFFLAIIPFQPLNSIVTSFCPSQSECDCLCRVLSPQPKDILMECGVGVAGDVGRGDKGCWKHKNK